MLSRDNCRGQQSAEADPLRFRHDDGDPRIEKIETFVNVSDRIRVVRAMRTGRGLILEPCRPFSLEIFDENL